MANNITNMISIVVQALPVAPPTSTSTTDPSPSPSASGTCRSTGQELVASPGFWALIIVLAGGGFGAGYLYWWRPASKRKDPESTPLTNVIMGVESEEIPEETSAGGDLQAPPPAVAPAPPTTHKKKRLTSAKAANATTTVRHSLHGAKEFFGSPTSDVLTGSVC